MPITLPGTQAMYNNIKEAWEKRKQHLAWALDSVLIEMANYIKADKNNWTDQTGNLRNSIGVAADVSGLTPVPESESVLSFPNTPKHFCRWEGDVLRGCIFAGMEYAVYVEYKENHWVISGALNVYRNKVMELISQRLNALEA